MEILFAVEFLVVGFSALVWGGSPERVITCCFVVAFLATVASPAAHGSYYSSFEWAVATVDIMLLVPILLVALISTRHWPVPLASMQLIDIFGHLTKLLDASILPQAYFFLSDLISIPMVGLLGVGTLTHRLRVRRFGRDYSWVHQLPASYRAGWPIDNTADDHS